RVVEEAPAAAQRGLAVAEQIVRETKSRTVCQPWPRVKTGRIAVNAADRETVAEVAGAGHEQSDQRRNREIAGGRVLGNTDTVGVARGHVYGRHLLPIVETRIE